MSEAGGVAHRLEQAAHNHLVVGSIPTAPTNQDSPSTVFYYVNEQCPFLIAPPRASNQKSPSGMTVGAILAPVCLILLYH